MSELDLVATVAGLSFGETNGFSRVVYGLAGLSAVYHAIQLGAQRRWSERPHATTA